ncbi:DMT family transporter [Aneurinibacillus sp. Ricciae_BoGa-3]|uniref:DMT family transporter n=1 Tax=Aneurinibacillus sp. Ricciae_BoGa-3 TaxID=3022697 RepID=UPI002340482B|nr:DMT family transporter [Aneurinibacillus sp. Ricciae_BoGa-3]WCK55520.1 DMT family transporter [Aneurinibacillus sp. Ricciae_BoGa-3]
MDNQPALNPYLALFFGVVAVSTSAILVKLSGAPAAIIATYRILFTVLLMLPIVLWKHLKEIMGISGRDWSLTALAGVFLAFHFILWFESLNYTSVTSSVVLVTLQPLFSFAGAYFFFKEKVRWLGLVGGLLALLGSIFIGWGDFKVGGLALWGDVLALLGAGMVTGYWLFGQSVRQRLSLMSYTFVVYGISTLTLLLYDLVLGYPLYPYRSNDWYVFLGLAVFPTLLGHTVFNWAIKWLSANIISMSILGEPVGSAILAYFILREKVTQVQFIGGLIILFGIYLFIKWNRPKVTETAKADALEA